ncbi:hypothetical protein PMAYCL1PPCAC_20301 [Pristionchus mayeri]|uniref:Uncharacterized protein n=1 Tax=Pristionchus mayeri TaxID=1317129 RepID=A0AAN5CSP2_9BILA|nr:hypothetical protein PMAYCL1PPCAC_20301 [Pristionchus mayeri]
MRFALYLVVTLAITHFGSANVWKKIKESYKKIENDFKDLLREANEKTILLPQPPLPSTTPAPPPPSQPPPTIEDLRSSLVTLATTHSSTPPSSQVPTIPPFPTTDTPRTTKQTATLTLLSTISFQIISPPTTSYSPQTLSPIPPSEPKSTTSLDLVPLPSTFLSSSSTASPIRVSKEKSGLGKVQESNQSASRVWTVVFAAVLVAILVFAMLAYRHYRLQAPPAVHLPSPGLPLVDIV